MVVTELDFVIRTYDFFLLLEHITFIIRTYH